MLKSIIKELSPYDKAVLGCAMMLVLLTAVAIVGGVCNMLFAE